ncbi:PoNe immunity protein domain-containing protein [Aliamphritea spongicola]|nr:PoNe immunity protein domain-containing protein [Aliamphritea spongicola]
MHLDESHLRDNWPGYWCYPLATLVALLNVDDSSFIDHEYYPTDLMRAWGKYRGAPVVLPPLMAQQMPCRRHRKKLLSGKRP